MRNLSISLSIAGCAVMSVLVVAVGSFSTSIRGHLGAWFSYKLQYTSLNNRFVPVSLECSSPSCQAYPLSRYS